MATVLDVAHYILDKKGELEAKKLHKLCYYAQGWHLAWEGTALFGDDFEAWVEGPASRDLYDKHRGRWVRPNAIVGRTQDLTEAQRCVIDAVLRSLGHKSTSE